MTEAAVLYAAIAFLFASLCTVAKLTWDERGKRVDSAEKQATYYREEIPKLINGIMDAQAKQEQSINQLADVIEKVLQGLASRQKEGTA